MSSSFVKWGKKLGAGLVLTGVVASGVTMLSSPASASAAPIKYGCNVTSVVKKGHSIEVKKAAHKKLSVSEKRFYAEAGKKCGHYDMKRATKTASQKTDYFKHRYTIAIKKKKHSAAKSYLKEARAWDKAARNFKKYAPKLTMAQTCAETSALAKQAYSRVDMKKTASALNKNNTYIQTLAKHCSIKQLAEAREYVADAKNELRKSRKDLVKDNKVVPDPNLKKKFDKLNKSHNKWNKADEVFHSAQYRIMSSTR